MSKETFPTERTKQPSFAFLLSTGHIVHRPYVIISIFSTNLPGWRGISLPTLSTYIIATRGTEQQLQYLDRLY